MLINCLFVGVGGALGAVGRYLLSLLSPPWAFPVMTLVTNFLGAVVIGAVVSLPELLPDHPARWTLFLKTGVCGGFTTFSTFSLETVGLFEQRAYAMGSAYVAASVGLCLAGVLLGRSLARLTLCK